MTIKLSDWFLDAPTAAQSAYEHNYNLWMVSSSIFIAIFASYCAIEIANRFATDKRRSAWMFLASLLLGVGVWAMHFIGMLAFRIDCGVYYNPWITLASMLPGIIAAAITLRPGIELTSTRQIVFSGVVMALGIGAMHYGGMAAISLDGILRYRAGLFVFSLVAAIVLSIAAFWCRAHFVRIENQKIARYASFVGAIVMGSAISSMHYIAMASTVFVNNGTKADSALITTISPTNLAFTIGMVTMMLIVGTHLLALNRLLRLYNRSQDKLRSLNLDLENKITERINELQESELRNSAILQNTTEGVMTIDSNGIIKTLNLAMERIFIVSSEKTVGHSISTLLYEPPELAANQTLVDYLQMHSLQDKSTFSEMRGRRSNGDAFPMEMAVREMQLKETTLFICTVRDITERKKADILKSEFISTVSHELRTPITSILGSLGLIANGVFGPIPVQAQHMVDMAHKNGQLLQRLINDLLDIEKLEFDKLTFLMQPQQLNLLVKQSMELVQSYGVKRQISLSLDDKSDDAFIVCDSQRVIQVLTNLLSNAMKYSPEKDQVSIAVFRQDKHMRIEVQDNGRGIPLEFYDRIFQKFAQADSSDTREKGGTGLGLAIAKKLVDKMGGKIGFQSKIEVGTMFFVEFPISNAHDHQAKKITAPGITTS